MQIDRREFLAAAGVTALSAMGPALVAAAPASALAVLVDLRVPESRLFAAGFAPAPCIEANLAEPLAMLDALDAALIDGRQIVACTQEATRFVVSELMRCRAAECVIIGRHRRLANARICHELEDCAAPGALAERLARSDWPLALAHSLGHSLGQPSRLPVRTGARFEVVAPALLDSPGYVVTWRLSMV